MESVLADIRDADRTDDFARRLEQAARDNFRFLWRCLHRFGVGPEHAVDDAVQRVFEIAAQKRTRIEPGHERAFLFKTALLVAAEERRRIRRSQHREIDDEGTVDAILDAAPQPDEIVEQQQWRKMLDVVLEKMDFDSRTVFVLFEFEGLSMAEVARLLEIPAGTVASRLRRAREVFHAQARMLKSRLSRSGGDR